MGLKLPGNAADGICNLSTSGCFAPPLKTDRVLAQSAALLGKSRKTDRDPLCPTASSRSMWPRVAAAFCQLTFRSTSSTASGCRAITANRTRAGVSGCDLRCSQFLSVAGGKPNLDANCAWLSPIFSRTFRTSICGTSTTVTRTLPFSPFVHAIASFNPRLGFAVFPRLAVRNCFGSLFAVHSAR